MKYYINGVLIQEVTDEKVINYYGAAAYRACPLARKNDNISTALSKEESSGDPFAIQVISSKYLYERYIAHCNKLSVKYRVLVVESEFPNPLADFNVDNAVFLGYEPIYFIPDDPEYSSLWADAVGDNPMADIKAKINKYGLFDTYEDALECKETMYKIDIWERWEMNKDECYIAKIYEAVNSEEIRHEKG